MGYFSSDFLLNNVYLTTNHLVMKKTSYLLLLVALFAFLSCENGSYIKDLATEESETYQWEATAEESVDYETELTDEENNQIAAGSYATNLDGDESIKNVNTNEDIEPSIDLKIIKTANLSIEVENYKTSITELKKIIQAYDAYISNENQHNYDYQIENNLIIRVETKDFEKLLEQITDLASKLDYKNVTSSDVTEEYVDILSRIKTKKEVEKRYLEILQKAKTINEILNVEEKIRTIREEIEAKEGRLKFLSNRVKYSTINLDIYQKLDYKYEPEKSPNFFERVFKALDSGWKGVVNFIIGLLYLWPFLVIGSIVFYFIRRKVKNRKSKA